MSKIKIICPLCSGEKFWKEEKKEDNSHIQCKGCLSILNYDKLIEKMKNKNAITFAVENNFQHRIMYAVFVCFENGGFNVDKFLFWFMKKFKSSGTSICIKILRGGVK